MRKIRSRKAVSPVIATVILVAVAITVAVAVSYWMGGITSQYTTFEKVEIQSGICIWNPATFNWEIALKLKNSGTATATLIGVFINDIEVDNYTLALPVNVNAQATTDMGLTVTIASGASTTINIYIDGQGDSGESSPAVAGTDYWQSVTAGTTINIKVHSAGGMDYIKLLELV